MIRHSSKLAILATAWLTACATVSSSDPVSENMKDAFAKADIIILGERHDNPEHHRLQAEIIDQIDAKGIAFEMVPEDIEDALNSARADGATSDNLRNLLNWDRSGWPDWEMYAPIFTAEPTAYIAGGEIDRTKAREAIASGAASQFDEAQAFGLDQPLPTTAQADLVQELIDSHCGMIPADVAETMVEAQRLRDASFAEASLRALEKGGAPVVLITGSGHARLDRGVPLYLKTAAPDLNVVSVGLTEPGETTDGLYDFVIETEAVEREDPCAAFKAMMGDKS
ncbi:MAG: ChaN family lipoprotein [Pseudomonadota bacterium]